MCFNKIKMALGWLAQFLLSIVQREAGCSKKPLCMSVVTCQWKSTSYISKAMVTLGVPGFKCFLIHSGVDEFPAVTRDQVDFGRYEFLFLVKDDNISNAKERVF